MSRLHLRSRSPFEHLTVCGRRVDRLDLLSLTGSASELRASSEACASCLRMAPAKRAIKASKRRRRA